MSRQNNFLYSENISIHSTLIFWSFFPFCSWFFFTPRKISTLWRRSFSLPFRETKSQNTNFSLQKVFGLFELLVKMTVQNLVGILCHLREFRDGTELRSAYPNSVVLWNVKLNSSDQNWSDILRHGRSFRISQCLSEKYILFVSIPTPK